ncbi:MAG: hypothetical protein EP332_04655 [Bacteroidetes bacterium]|nr:MAG: hypothetical protein EP332_04655 [Bacteroidota bacterium]
MSLSFLIEELNKTLLELQGSELPPSFLDETECVIRIISNGRKVERLPSSWARLSGLSIEGLHYRGFEDNIEPLQLKKLSLIKGGSYEQASTIRDREFEALSKWVIQNTGSFFFIPDADPQTVYWVYPNFREELKEWFLTSLYGPRQKS